MTGPHAAAQPPANPPTQGGNATAGIRTEPMTVNIGPQHPSTHGVFRLRVTFDGEEILQVEPIFGYLHRGTEKLAEERNYTQIVTLTDRLDYVSSMINNQAYCLAVEKLLNVEVPPRGKFLRTLAAELQRIAAHLMGIGFILQDLGTLGTPLMYCFRSPRAHPGSIRDALRRPRNRKLYAPRRRLLRRPPRILARPGSVPKGFRCRIRRTGAANPGKRNSNDPHPRRKLPPPRHRH